jgi:FKBP-type peptidyl-prolyl cis-trans isomerase (trigger factor)
VPLDEDAMIQNFGLESGEMLREQVKLALERRRDQDQAMVLRKQAIAAVSDLVEMEIPEKTSANQAERDLQRLRTDLQSSGRLSEDEIEAKVAQARSGSDEESIRRLKSFFILSKLAEHFHVTVSEGEVNTKIAELAMQNGVRPDEMRNNLAKQGQLPQIQSVVREDKAADQLVAACTVTDMPAEEWQAMQAGESPKKKTPKKKTAKKSASKKKTSNKKTTKKS